MLPNIDASPCGEAFAPRTRRYNPPDVQQMRSTRTRAHAHTHAHTHMHIHARTHAPHRWFSSRWSSRTRCLRSSGPPSRPCCARRLARPFAAATAEAEAEAEAAVGPVAAPARVVAAAAVSRARLDSPAGGPVCTCVCVRGFLCEAFLVMRRWGYGRGLWCGWVSFTQHDFQPSCYPDCLTDMHAIQKYKIVGECRGPVPASHIIPTLMRSSTRETDVLGMLPATLQFWLAHETMR